MAFEIRYKASAARDLEKLPKQTAARIVDSINSTLPDNPYAGKALKGKYKGLYRLRVGDFRVIYTVLREVVVVLVLKIADRKEVYR